MKDTTIYQALQKLGLDYLDVEYHIERLFSFPEDKYFMPNNKDEQDYSICNLLASLNLVETKRVPKWRDGFSCGLSIWFKYNKDLNY